MLLRRLWSWRADLAFWSVWFALVGAFVALAAWADSTYRLPFDKEPTFWVQDLERYAWADPLFERVNRLGDYEVVAAVLIASVLVLIARGLRFEALIMAGAGAMAWVHAGVRAIVERPQDFEGLEAGRIYPGPDGFPSGHVFGQVIVYGLVFAFIGRVIPFRPIVWAVRAGCVALIALGGPARMYTSAHWPSDVIGAAMLAAIYLLLAWRLDRVIEHVRATDGGAGDASEAGHRDHDGSASAADAGTPGASPRVDAASAMRAR